MASSYTDTRYRENDNRRKCRWLGNEN